MAEEFGHPFRICSRHKFRNLLEQMKPLQLDAEVANRVHDLFTTITKTRRTDRAEACVIEMIELMPTIEPYIRSEIFALLPHLSPAYGGSVAGAVDELAI